MKFLNLEMSILSKFIHLNRILLSEKIKKIDSSLRKPQALIILHTIPEKSFTVGELARMLDVTPGAITHASKILIKKGYLKRENGEDLRKVYLKLTEKGLKLRKKIIDEFKKVNDTLLSFLTDDERATFLALLEKITKKLEKNIEEKHEENN